MTTRDIPIIDPRQGQSAKTEQPKDVPYTTFLGKRFRGAVGTSVVLLFLWAGFHWYDPASWAVGIPTALIGGALTLFLPATTPRRLSPIGGLRFAMFAIFGILRGAVDVSVRSLIPSRLHPGCLTWQTDLPEGRPRQLFAVAITLLPGTLTAKMEDDMLTVHALHLSDSTRDELAALQAHIAKLYRIDPEEMLP
jgi:multicomponent Na+:H+ antiporter subunit E